MRNTQTMTGVPAPTLYHRWLGWHALAMRRALTVLSAGLIVAVVLLPFVTWGLALAGGWDAAALTFLLTTWPIIIRADSARAAASQPPASARPQVTNGRRTTATISPALRTVRARRIARACQPSQRWYRVGAGTPVIV